MSQITRCPSCSTTFKVVADQLRISEGWVRCGQCKEVFDASAHLLAAAPAALLPDDISLTDVRPPPTPVARPSDAGRAWGQPPATPAAPRLAPERFSPPAGAALRQAPPPAAPANAEWEGPGAEETGSNVGSASSAAATNAPAESTLAVPLSTVPAFLSAESGGTGPAGPLDLVGASPFSWRTSASAGSVAATVQGSGAAEETSVPGSDTLPPAVPSPALARDVPSPRVLPPLPPIPGGYELPAAEPAEPDELAEAGDAIAGSDASVELTPMGYPALELPLKAAAPAGPPQAIAPVHSAAASPQDLPDAVEPLPPVDFVALAASPAREMDAEALALVEDRSPAAVLQAAPRKAVSAPAEREAAENEDDGAADTASEVSFVRAARRQAFWRKPLVRVALVGMILLALAGIGAQFAVQERDRLAAAEPRLRPLLVALCASLQCEIAPPRQITDIVIDSSSFNKARGDSYQLSLTMKSKASIPLAMPAVELTLTDAQDQPVLRRVLLPADMGAPVQLAANGEWSASLAVIVTTGGARVAGYRLLAFYP